jgi:hypothetical protein
VHWLRLATMLQLIPRSQADTRGMRQGNPIAGQPVRYNPQIGTPYGAEAKPIMSPLGMPCTKPPYGMIAAIDLDTLRVKWQRPLGTAHDAGPLGLRSGLPISIGTPISGGAVTTAGGLIFIGTTTERAFRGIDSETGNILWKGPPPHPRPRVADHLLVREKRPPVRADRSRRQHHAQDAAPPQAHSLRTTAAALNARSDGTRSTPRKVIGRAQRNL